MCFCASRDLRVVVRLFRYWTGSSDWWTSIVHHSTNHCLLLLLRLLQVPSNQPRGCYRHSRSCPYGCHGEKHQEHRFHETAGQRGSSFTLNRQSGAMGVKIWRESKSYQLIFRVVTVETKMSPIFCLSCHSLTLAWSCWRKNSWQRRISGIW